MTSTISTIKTMAPQRPRLSVDVDPAVLLHLNSIAADVSVETGGRVTQRDLVIEALKQTWGPRSAALKQLLDAEAKRPAGIRLVKPSVKFRNQG